MAVIVGTPNNDSLTGTSGDDTITGLAGNDSILGGGGVDSIEGGAGADTVFGGSGDDIIVAGRSDSIDADDGDDQISLADDGISNTFTSINGDLGTDTLTLDFSAATDGVSAAHFGGGSGSMEGISYSGIEQLVITGGTASDNLVGGAGNDTLTGGAGSDRLNAGLGVNRILGGLGSDIGLIDLTGTAAGLIVNFTGGANITIAGNTLQGVEGLGFRGGLGDDNVDVSNATRGSELFGGDGADTLRGAASYADILNGGIGADLITLGRSDTVSAGDGDDDLRLTDSALSGAFTSVAGEAGVDILTLNFGAATDGLSSANFGGGSGSMEGVSYSGIETLSITGGSASDFLVGGEGNDTLTGGTGSDRLEGRGGTNRLLGGAGVDFGGIDLSTSVANLNVNFNGAANNTIVGNVLQGVEGLGLRTGSGNDSIDVSLALRGSEIFGNAGNDDIIGAAAYADLLDGGIGNDDIAFGRSDTVRGGDGNDIFRTVEGGAVAFTSVNGDAGTDQLRLDFSTAVDSLASSNFGGGSGSFAGISYAGIETLFILGGAASDSLAGGAGNDTIDGGSGGDRIDGFAGANTLTGGTGRDIGLIDLSITGPGLTVVFNNGGANAIGGNSLTGFEGLGLRAGVGADDIDVSAGTRGSELQGGGGDDTLTGAASQADSLSGGLGNDQIFFGGSDTVQGGDGDDDLRATLSSAVAFTSVAGDAGVDLLTVNFSAATDGISGSNFGGGSGTLGGISYSGVETLVITGGTASDTIVVGTGNDTLTGGAGRDRLDAGAGANRITGGAGIDIGLIDLSATGAGVTVNFTGANINIAGNVLQTIEGLGLKAGSGDDDIDVSGAQRGSELFGNAGDDTLDGGNVHADVLNGGIGADRIDFGRFETVSGGDGNDDLRFTSNTNAGFTSVAGDAGIDTLTLTFTGSPLAVSSSSFGGGSGQAGGVSYSGIETLSMIGGLENDTLTGGAGNDTLNGGLGADSLTGGLGADRFRYTALTDSTVAIPGRDVITDFGAGDRIDLSAIDAVTGGGDNAFSFIGAGAFTGVAGQLRSVTTTETIVSGDVNGDGSADFAIRLDDPVVLAAGDFIL